MDAVIITGDAPERSPPAGSYRADARSPWMFISWKMYRMRLED